MIVNNISKLMGERRMSITDLAEKADISYVTASNLYHHKSIQIRYDVMNKLCAALGVGIGDLFTYIED